MALFDRLFSQYLLFAILFLFSTPSMAQNKTRNIMNYEKCLFDSLRQNGIDTILIGDYSFDSGVNTQIQQFFFWKENGKGRLLLLKGSENDFSIKNIYDDVLGMDLAFYKNHRLDTMRSAIKTDGYESHGYGWGFNIKTKNKTAYLKVLDYERKGNPADIRCRWVESIAGKVKKYW